MTEPETRRTCSTCSNAEMNKGGHLECHGGPPAGVPAQHRMTGQPMIVGVFPVVDPALWCAAWKPVTAPKIVTLVPQDSSKKTGGITDGNP